MSATRYYVCANGHEIATPHELTTCPLAICETELRQTGGTGLRKQRTVECPITLNVCPDKACADGCDRIRQGIERSEQVASCSP